MPASSSRTPAVASSSLHSALVALGVFSAPSSVYLLPNGPRSHVVALAAKRAAIAHGFSAVLQVPSCVGSSWVLRLFVAPPAPVRCVSFYGCSVALAPIRPSVKFIAAVNLLSSVSLGGQHWLVRGYRSVARLASIRKAAVKFGVKLHVVRPFGGAHWSVWVSMLPLVPASFIPAVPGPLFFPALPVPSVPAPVAPAVQPPAPAAPVVLGFSGSRMLSQGSAHIAGFVLSSAVAQPGWASFAVGCCPTGLDLLVRQSSAVPASRLSVFRAASRHPRHLVKRSSALACSVGALVAFPECPCPGGLVPSSVSSRCFCGKGSGTWATAALAAGRGAAVYVAGVAPGALPVSWGQWVRSCRLPGCWRLVPCGSPQLSLF